MEGKFKHISSLLGRVFLIAQPEATNLWNGTNENQNGEIDYDLIGNFISYEEGDLTHAKLYDLDIYIYFSMSSKIEIFTIENGFIICDGLYFNESWDYEIDLDFQVTDVINLEVEVKDKIICIFDAVLTGKDIISDNKSKDIIDSLTLNLFDGFYSVSKVEVIVNLEGQEVLLKGVKISQ